MPASPQGEAFVNCPRNDGLILCWEIRAGKLLRGGIQHLAQAAQSLLWSKQAQIERERHQPFPLVISQYLRLFISRSNASVDLRLPCHTCLASSNTNSFTVSWIEAKNYLLSGACSRKRLIRNIPEIVRKHF